jgi:hypothetical protein
VKKSQASGISTSFVRGSDDDLLKKRFDLYRKAETRNGTMFAAVF